MRLHLGPTKPVAHAYMVDALGTPISTNPAATAKTAGTLWTFDAPTVRVPYGAHTHPRTWGRIPPPGAPSPTKVTW